MNVVPADHASGSITRPRPFVLLHTRYFCTSFFCSRKKQFEKVSFKTQHLAGFLLIWKKGAGNMVDQVTSEWKSTWKKKRRGPWRCRGLSSHVIFPKGALKFFCSCKAPELDGGLNSCNGISWAWFLAAEGAAVPFLPDLPTDQNDHWLCESVKRKNERLEWTVILLIEDWGIYTQFTRRLQKEAVAKSGTDIAVINS